MLNVAENCETKPQCGTWAFELAAWKLGDLKFGMRAASSLWTESLVLSMLPSPFQQPPSLTCS